MPTPKYGFYSDQSTTALTSSYVVFQFGCQAAEIDVINDDTTGSNKISISFDGVNQHGLLSAGQFISYTTVPQSIIYLKYVTGAPSYRLMVAARG